MSSKFPTPDTKHDPDAVVPTIHLKEGDTGPPLEVRLTDDTDDAIALDSSTDSVQFDLEHPNRDDVTLNNSAEITAGAEGVVEYKWASGDTDTPGQYFGEFVVTFNEGESDERTETFPSAGYIPVVIHEQVEDAE